MQYKLYGNTTNIISSNNINLNDSIVTVSKKEALNLNSFFSNVILNVSITNNVFNINDITYNNSIMKSSDNVLNNYDTYSFNVRNAYVISVDKNVMKNINNFYCMVKNIDSVNNNNNRIVFRASNEFNLNDAFKNADNSNSSNLENSNNKKPVSKKTGSGWLIFICIIMGILLTIMSVMIGISIMNAV